MSDETSDKASHKEEREISKRKSTEMKIERFIIILAGLLFSIGGVSPSALRSEALVGLLSAAAGASLGFATAKSSQSWSKEDQESE